MRFAGSPADRVASWPVMRDTDRARDEGDVPHADTVRRPWVRGTRLMLVGGLMLVWTLVVHVTTPGGHWAGLSSFGLTSAICVLVGIVLAVAQRR